MGFITDTLGYVGSTLDKTLGGRASRGLLAGKPRELLSPIPFSDQMGLTDPGDFTSGRNVTDSLGFTDPNSKHWSSSVPGFGVDLLADPANLLAGAGLAKKLLTSGNRLGDLATLSKMPPASGFTHFSSRPPVSSRPLPHGAPSSGLIHPASPRFSMDPSLFPNTLSPEEVELYTRFGPREAGGLEKMDDIVSPYRHNDTLSGLHNLWRQNRDTPHGLAIANEFPEGSYRIGGGSEGDVFSYPGAGDHVIRLANAIPPATAGRIGSYEMGRANIPEMLQPVRSVRYGGVRVEHLPRTTPIFGDTALRDAIGMHPNVRQAESAADQLQGIAGVESDNLARSVHADPNRHLAAWDVSSANPTNVSFTREGRLIAHDPGSIWSTKPTDDAMYANIYGPESGDFIGVNHGQAIPLIAPKPLSPVTDPALIRLLESKGSPSMVRDILAREIAATGTQNQGIDFANWRTPFDVDQLRSSVLSGGPIPQSLLSSPVHGAPLAQVPGSQAGDSLRALLGSRVSQHHSYSHLPSRNLETQASKPPSFMKRNRIPLALGALASSDLARLASIVGRPER